MRKLYAVLVAVALCFPVFGAKAWWQSIQQVGISTTVPVTVAFGTGTNPNSSTTPSVNAFTFTSQPYGTADVNRIVVVGIQQNNCTTSCGIASVTIGGVSATQATGAACAVSTTTKATDIWYAAVPTGTSGNIVVNTTTVTTRVNITVYSVTGIGAAFSAATSSCPAINTVLVVSGTVVTPLGGVTLGFGLMSAAASLASTTNLTTNASSSTCCGTNWIASGNNTALSGSNTYSFTYTGSFGAIEGSFVSFSP